MTWAHPFLLFSLVAVLVPIVLHLFGKKTRRIIRLPTISILIQALEARRKKSRLREILLLLLRSAFLIFLIFAVARPFLKREGGTALSANARNVIILVDNTLSMSTLIGKQPLFALAQERAASLVKEVRPNDSFLIRPLVATGVAQNLPTDDRTRLQQEIEMISLSFKGGTVHAALGSALAALPPEPPPEIHFITDGTQEAWKGQSLVNRELSLQVWDVSKGAPRFNATLVGFRTQFSEAQNRGTLSAQIKLYDPPPGPIQVQMELLLDNQWKLLERTFKSLPKSGEVEFGFAIPNQPAIARLQLGPDSFAADNVLYFPLQGNPRPRITLINGNPHTDPRQDAAFFIRSALASTFEVLDTTLTGVSPALLSESTAIFLIDAANLPAPLAKSLEAFARKGGSLIVSAGETFNQPQFPSEIQSLVPSPLRLIRHSPEESGTPLTPPTGPFEFLREEKSRALSQARVNRWVVSEPMTNGQILLKLADGYPLLTQRQIGEGNLLFWASSFNLAWNNLPLNSAYPALIRTLVLHASTPRSPRQRIETAKIGDHSFAGIFIPIDGGERNFPDRPGLWRRTDIQNEPLVLTQADTSEFDLTRVEVQSLGQNLKPLRLMWNLEESAGRKITSRSYRYDEKSALFALLMLLVFVVESFLSGRLPRWAIRIFLLIYLIPTPSHASGSDISIGWLQLGTPPSYDKPLRGLLLKARDLANLKLEADLKMVHLPTTNPYEYPFLYAAGDREFPIPTPPVLSAIRDYLSKGGMIFFDDAVGGVQSDFFVSVQKTVAAIFPAKTFQPTPADHPIYRSFFLLNAPWGRRTDGKLLHIDVDRRTVLFYFSGDLAGAVESGVPGQTEKLMATRFGTNLLMYALTLDYKADQIHIPFILQRRQ